MKWWMQHKFRMIQNNLRDIDAGMDIDYEIEKLKEFGANVVQVGCGGISAFSETALDCQKKSPYLADDMFGKLVEKCHENGIRVIARFDVSKVHERFEAEHPEWLARKADGSPIRYNDTVAACLNGPYQQEKTLEIIREILQKYPVDGIFFNMFGYPARDYDDKPVGICQCESCKKRFSEWSGGMQPPLKEDEGDPVYQKYQEFRKYTVRDILEKIRRTVDEVNPEAALSTYASHMVDIIRTESNSAVDRPYPFWLYSGSDNAGSIEDTFEDKVSSNCAINAVDLPYRFMGVDPYLNRLRLYQDMANGSNLDWCIIGSFEDYPDRQNDEGVKEVFHFQKRYQEYFDRLSHHAPILLIRPGIPHAAEADAEYNGIYRALKEAHLEFETAISEELDRFAGKVSQYGLIILPGIKKIESEKFLAALKTADTALLATGCSLQDQPEALLEIFGQKLGERIERVRGSYFETEPKSIFRSFPRQDWVYLDREFRKLEGEGKKILPYISASTYGPPERCFGHRKTELCGGAVYQDKRVYLPWQPGTLYHQHGYRAFRLLLLDLIRMLGAKNEDFDIQAHESVEVFWRGCGEDRFLLQLLNLSGWNGTTGSDPIVQHGIRISWKKRVPKSMKRLEMGGERTLCPQQEMELCALDAYAAYLVEF